MDVRPVAFFSAISFTEHMSMVILVAGSTLLVLILIVAVATIVYCMRTKEKVLPPADLIPKVRANGHMHKVNIALSAKKLYICRI